MYSKAFKRALWFTLQWEGGYSNHPNDRGGPTNFGITQKVYDEYRKAHNLSTISIKDIVNEEVEEIYYNQYWKAIKGDDLPEANAVVAFDWAVNSGVASAKKALQVGNKDAQQMLKNRERFYRSISFGKNEVFIKGWLNRLQALKIYVRGE